MPFNGSGVFQRVRNWVADATAGIKIRADFHDAEDDGFAAGLTNCITKDGQTIVTQNIPFNSKRATGLADPINDQDAATKKYADTKFASGGTMTGNLTISKDEPQLILDATNTTSSDIVGQRTGKTRWLMRLGNGGAETGANAGSDFDLHHYDDTGTLIGPVALLFSRATGLGTVGGDPTAPLGIATKQYADNIATNATNAANSRVLRTGDTMTGELVTSNTAAPIHGTTAVGTIRVVGGGPHSAITFLVPGQFGTNFGMATDGNFYMGGITHGSNLYKFWTTKDFGTAPASAELVDALVKRIEALETKLLAS